MICVIFVGHIQIAHKMLQHLVRDLHGTGITMFHADIGGSNIANVQARALEDGQLPIIVYRYASLTFRDRDNDWKRSWQGEERTPPRHTRWGRARNFTPWACMFRHPKITGKDTTQETLRSLD